MTLHIGPKDRRLWWCPRPYVRTISNNDRLVWMILWIETLNDICMHVSIHQMRQWFQLCSDCICFRLFKLYLSLLIFLFDRLQVYFITIEELFQIFLMVFMSYFFNSGFLYSYTIVPYRTTGHGFTDTVGVSGLKFIDWNLENVKIGI